MIDWKNLEPLPLKRQRDTRDRERLAENAHRKRAAKHKGRNHWANWERRQMLAAKKAEGKKHGEKRQQVFRAYAAAVREYWRGLRTDHPAKPA